MRLNARTRKVPGPIESAPALLRCLRTPAECRGSAPIRTYSAPKTGAVHLFEGTAFSGRPITDGDIALWADEASAQLREHDLGGPASPADQQVPQDIEPVRPRKVAQAGRVEHQRGGISVGLGHGSSSASSSAGRSARLAWPCRSSTALDGVIAAIRSASSTACAYPGGTRTDSRSGWGDQPSASRNSLRVGLLLAIARCDSASSTPERTAWRNASDHETR